MKNHRWTRPQINYIREKYPTTPAKILAAEMGLTYSSVAKAITQHNIKKKVHIHTWINGECKECGIRRKRVYVWAYSKDNFNTRTMDLIPECAKYKPRN